MWASGLPSGSFLVHGTWRQHGAHCGSGAAHVRVAIQKSQQLCAGSGAGRGQAGKLP